MNDEIISSWHSLQTKEDLLNILNIAKRNLYGDGCYPFTIASLNHHLYNKEHSQYSEFGVPKKDGTERKIQAPNKGLMHIQKCLNYIFTTLYKPSKAAMGFIPNRSVVSNAKLHLKKKYVYNIDLKDFFTSISSKRVHDLLSSDPYNIPSSIAWMITNLCCCKLPSGDQVLPQGAPTSPILSNMICSSLDYKLGRLARKYDITFSRYADDITFSGDANIFETDGEFVKNLKEIITKEHFVINEKKVRIQDNQSRQEVTGITVNKKPNVSKKYVKQLRTMLNNWEKGGYEEAQQIFIEHYSPTKHKGSNHHIENIIEGKLCYLKMVKGENDHVYRKLSNRFSILKNLKNSGNLGPLPKKESIKEDDLLKAEKVKNTDWN